MNKDNQAITAAAPSLFWRLCSSLPASVGVRLIFEGLMGFYYNTKTGNCEIGFHGSNAHKTQIWVFQKPGCQPILLPPAAHVPNAIQQMTVEIPDLASNVCFYENGSTFDRLN